MNLTSALALIDSVSTSKVLFIGETIIDEYRFVAPLSKPPKESVLAVRALRSEAWQGGIVAARAHAQSLCETGVMTVGNSIRKIRYVEENYARKLFEVQDIQDGKPARFIDSEILERYNTLCVHDYGHGMMSSAFIEQLEHCGVYLCVGTQTNAANAGFNLITKYARADYICVDEPEARLAAADRDSPIEHVMRKLAEGRCSKMIVTHGRHGAYGLYEGRFVHMPTNTKLVVDTMGAGDAFFAVTAPMAKYGSIEDLLVIGNAAGSLKTQILGHRESVTKEKLIAYLKAHCD